MLGLVRLRSPAGTRARNPQVSSSITPAEIRPLATSIVTWAAESGGLELADDPFLLQRWHFGLKFKAV